MVICLVFPGFPTLNFTELMMYDMFSIYLAGPVELGWQLPLQYFDFFKVSTKKEFENQTKTGRLAANSNFFLILFISSKNSFCKTVHFLGPNPKFEFIEVIAIFSEVSAKKIMKLNIRAISNKVI